MAHAESLFDRVYLAVHAGDGQPRLAVQQAGAARRERTSAVRNHYGPVNTQRIVREWLCVTGEWMIGRTAEHEVHSLERRTLDAGLGRRIGHANGEIDAVFDERLPGAAEDFLANTNIDRRMGAMEVGQRRPEFSGGNEAVESDAQLRLPVVGQPLRGSAQFAAGGEDTTAFLEQKPSGRREYGAMPASIEHGEAEICFKLADGVGDGRRHPIQRCGRCRKAAVAVDRIQRFQCFEPNRQTLSAHERRYQSENLNEYAKRLRFLRAQHGFMLAAVKPSRIWVVVNRDSRPATRPVSGKRCRTYTT